MGVSTRRERGFTVIELLVTLAVVASAAAIALPMVGNLLANIRISGDTRAISNTTSIAKMRAAALFTSSRIYADLTAGTYRVQVWRKTGPPAWVDNGESYTLSSNVSFGFASIATPPVNTQGTIGQATACRADDGTVIAGTACVVFNSRGLPIDDVGSPIGSGAFYVRDASAAYGVTVSATGVVRVWRTPLASTPIWTLQ